MITRATISGEPAARWTFRAAVVAAIAMLIVIGRNQWFTRDDWGFVLSRNRLHQQEGWQDWLFQAQDGHWMTPPILLYRGAHLLFGIDSYWPFLGMVYAMHIGIVLLARQLCLRAGANQWTATFVGALLLVFGNGWENIVFAIQITFNLSLLAFLAQMVLVDHDGEADRRDVAGAVIGLIGVMSSGFGPFFILGVGVLLALRRRWRALAIAVVPQGAAYLWWYVTWQTDGAAEAKKGRVIDIPRFVARGLWSSFESLTIIPGLAAVAIAASLAVILTKRWCSREQTLLIALWVTTLAMLFGVGLHRVGQGIAFAGSSRYQYVIAMLCAPAFACAIDLLRRVRWRPLIAVGLAVVVLAAASNAHSLRVNALRWGRESSDQKYLYELIAGSTSLFPGMNPDIVPVATNPDVQIKTLPELIEEHAITPDPPDTQGEADRVAHVLGLPAPALPATATAGSKLRQVRR